MKKFLSLAFLVLFGAVCFAQTDTGIDKLIKLEDHEKNGMYDKREKPTLDERQLEFLKKQGYTKEDIEKLALLAKESGKSINDVAALKSQGVGWGVLAKRLGVRPDALKKIMKDEKKAEKKKMKEMRKKERMEMKEKMQEKREMMKNKVDEHKEMMKDKGEHGKGKMN